MHRHALAGTILLLVLSATAGAAQAGALNPNISILGQPFVAYTDDPSDPNRGRGRLDAGETEIVFDDYLNPYARGYFVMSLGGEGMALEEGYFTLFRGLPAGIAVRGGKYRLPFGAMNPQHRHAYPFAEPFALLTAYLPGEEAFNETGVDVSRRFPIAGDFSVNAQVEVLQGDSFRMEREPTADLGDPLNADGDDRAGESRPAFLGRLSGFTMLGERSALEFGISAAGGTNNVAAGTRTTVYGADAKTKLWTSPQAYLLLQAEVIGLNREAAGWDPVDGYTYESVKPAGGYVFADYNFAVRYNVGGGFERYQEPAVDKPVTHSFGLWAGYSLMEETTVFRLDWRHVAPEAGDGYNTVVCRVIYSMGPHKAHQF
jgi:hypothetical protein